MRIRLLWLFYGFCSALLLPRLVWAEGEIETLERFFSSLESLQGDFHQQVQGVDGKLIEESRGVLRIQRPGKFHWQTTTPFLQEVVADGERIWVYDPDLEQVTVYRQQGGLANTPAALLTHAGPLQLHFTLHHLAERDEINDASNGASIEKGGLVWVGLTPKQGQGGFERLLVAMDGEQLRMIEVEDSLGQRTRITLHDLMINLSLPPHHFEFLVPDGVDRVGEP